MLTIVPTPIGNLKDITLRAKEALEVCIAIICEDTRVSGHLLQLLGLPRKELISFHGYTDHRKIEIILNRLKQGEHLCLVSDAGTPGISDPGFTVVSEVRKAGIRIEALPGPSAFLVALSASGLPINQFMYLGFLPLKKGRKSLIASWTEEEKTIVFYESPHRIVKTLAEICTALSKEPKRTIVIARELTKMHEEILTTTVNDAPVLIKNLKIKGEFVVIIGPKNR